MAINIPKLLPLVRKEFPKAPLANILRAMYAFSQAHPNVTDDQAIQIFQAGLQKARQPKPLFQGLVSKILTGATNGPIR